jgi:hypothetical protein
MPPPQGRQVMAGTGVVTAFPMVDSSALYRDGLQVLSPNSTPAHAVDAARARPLPTMWCDFTSPG